MCAIAPAPLLRQKQPRSNSMLLDAQAQSVARESGARRAAFAAGMSAAY